MSRSRGIPLLLLVLLLPPLCQNGREALRDDGPPAFFVDRQVGVWVGLGAGFPRPGIHQFSDGTTLAGVMEMTGVEFSNKEGVDYAYRVPLQTGVSLDLIGKENQVLGIMGKWLPAGQRIALGIPLHPDRMGEEDWEVLPGIGVKMARSIEEDRQINGDYGSLQTLERVRGIGPKRLNSWKTFFLDP